MYILKYSKIIPKEEIRIGDIITWGACHFWCKVIDIQSENDFKMKEIAAVSQKIDIDIRFFQSSLDNCVYYSKIYNSPLWKALNG